jgi:TRAP-type C4-dicarboxylate transport system permease large subunit
MGSAKGWRIGLFITLLVFNVMEVIILIVTGSSAIGNCLPPKLWENWSACIANIGIGKIALAAWLPGNILLVVLVVATFLFPWWQGRHGGARKQNDRIGETIGGGKPEPDPDIDLDDLDL